MSRPFRTVAVLKGGPAAAEREVSLRSGAAVAAGLRAAGYEVVEVDVRTPALDLPPGVEAAFVALHGAFGEDGQIQELLEAYSVPYTGSAPAACRASYDKRLSKQHFAAAGIPTPDYELWRPGRPRRLPLPVVVKPPCQGSTVGAHRVLCEADWAPATADALRFGDEALVETYIAGRELTVGIVGDEALPVIEIEAPDGWYDYAAKYTPGLTRYRVPAPLDAAVADRCRRLGLEAYRALGCRSMGRVDFRMDAQGGLYALELNNIPGFTETSLLPKAAQAAGIGFPALCDRILRLAAEPAPPVPVPEGLEYVVRP